ncbi:MAG: DUF1559 domain-containing protein [Armatimonadetes bacterium]|nr:DUF1559 domain-containing protein [Armatimonadota bacterium]
MRLRRGFTLIELLVVIAIIAILASILFPVFSRARAKARQAACMNNLKQLGTAFHMYCQDYDELLPSWCFWAGAFSNDNGPAQQAYTWDTVLQPYIRNVQILLCPDSPYGKTCNEPNYGNIQIRSYAMPRYVGDAWGGNRNGSTGYILCPLDAPPSPSATVLLQEKGERGIGIVGDAAAENFAQSHGSTGFGRKDDLFHNNGKNFLFLDGHVKWYAKAAGPFSWPTRDGRCDPPRGKPPRPPGVEDPWPLEAHGPGHCEFYTDWPEAE